MFASAQIHDELLLAILASFPGKVRVHIKGLVVYQSPKFSTEGHVTRVNIPDGIVEWVIPFLASLLLFF